MGLLASRGGTMRRPSLTHRPMHANRLLLLPLLAIACLSGCNGSQTGRHVTIAGVSQFSAADKAVLDRRLGLDGTFAFLHPATTYVVHDGRLDIDIGATGDTDDELKSLLSRQGRFSVSGEDGQVWLDQSALADVTANFAQAGDGLMLVFTLTQEGGQRLAQRTSHPDLTTIMVLKLDDATLASARVNSPLGGRFQAPIHGSAQDAMRLAQVMRSGALSFKPGDVTVGASPR